MSDGDDEPTEELRGGWETLNQGLEEIWNAVRSRIRNQSTVTQALLFGILAFAGNVIYDLTKIAAWRIIPYVSRVVDGFPEITNELVVLSVVGAMILHGVAIGREIKKLQMQLERMNAPAGIDGEEMRADGGEESDLSLLLGMAGGAMVGYAIGAATFPDWAVAGAIMGALVSMRFLESI
mgnify:FL=1